MRPSFSSTHGQKAMARLAIRGVVTALVVVSALMTSRRRAQADGAFPAAQSILLDVTRPLHIVLATNFGLVTTGDGGASWSYGCETPLAANAFLYSGAAPVSPRVWALGSGTLVFSDDEGCTWQRIRGVWQGASVRDYFVDRRDHRRVLALVSASSPFSPVDGASAASSALVVSSDGGETFATAPLLTFDDEAAITSVEIARSSGAFYAIVRPPPARAWTLAVSRDEGTSWQTHDLQAFLDAQAGADATPSLAAVDRDDDTRAYLRIRVDNGTRTDDGLALVSEEGASLSLPLFVEGATFAAFLQREDGTLLVAGRDGASGGLGFRSDDRGRTFQPWTVAPLRVVGLAERGSTLFAATDNFNEHMALAISENVGATWTGILSFDRISSVQACVRTVCGSDCERRAELGLFPAATCGSAEGQDGAVDGGSGGAGEMEGGCGCASAPQANGGGAGTSSRTSTGAVAIAATLLACAKRRRRVRARGDSRCGEEGDLDSSSTTV